MIYLIEKLNSLIFNNGCVKQTTCKIPQNIVIRFRELAQVQNFWNCGKFTDYKQQLLLFGVNFSLWSFHLFKVRFD